MKHCKCPTDESEMMTLTYHVDVIRSKIVNVENRNDYFQTDIVNYWLRVEETLTEGKSLFLR